MAKYISKSALVAEIENLLDKGKYHENNKNMIELDKIYNEDCLNGMKRIPDGSVDAIICDLPYGTTKNS